MRAAEDLLRAAHGAVVTIASTRARMSEPDTEAYAASKGGLVALTHALAISLGPDVRVNCISPGWIFTKGDAPRPEDHAFHPAGRVGHAWTISPPWPPSCSAPKRLRHRRGVRRRWRGDAEDDLSGVDLSAGAMAPGSTALAFVPPSWCKPCGMQRTHTMPDTLPDPAADPTLAAERVLILDFGSQVTQLIARRLRESGVYCEIWPFNADPARIAAWQPRGIILSGGPASVHEAASPLAPQAVFDSGVPILGICYGEQLLCQQLGGAVEGSDHREFGRAFVDGGGRLRAVPRRVGQGRARAGVDEPRRPRDQPAARLPRGGHQRGRALRRHRRR